MEIDNLIEVPVKHFWKALFEVAGISGEANLNSW